MQIVKIQRNSKYKWNNRIWWRWWISCGRKTAQRLSRIPLQRINNMCITLSRPFTWSWTPQKPLSLPLLLLLSSSSSNNSEKLDWVIIAFVYAFQAYKPGCYSTHHPNEKKNCYNITLIFAGYYPFFHCVT